ncbi:MAG: PadR family transcriptional regulator [Pirellulaceae bacterium]
MSNTSTRKFQKELNSGAVSLVVLCVVEQMGRPVYGYEVARLLQLRSVESMPMNEGAVYPVLRSLERQSLLTSDLVPSDVGPPRKYYRLTDDGLRTLSAWKRTWRDTTAFVNAILENPSDADPARSTSTNASTSR